MWLLDYVTKNAFQKDEIRCGEVTASGSDTVAVNTSLEHRNMPIVAPFGVAYNPPLSKKSVVIPIDDGHACVGVISSKKSLEPGEVMLYSSGGASIVLKNDGTVLINGKVFE